ncbi:MAG: cobyrinic acid a,c-diamide synthase, partial [Pseudomonadota bacterium]
IQSLRNASQFTDIYGECGGYMTLGTHLIDDRGKAHEMAGLLDLVTSFKAPKLTLGYRQLEALGGPMAGRWRGHEFHHSHALEERGTALFQVRDPDNGARAPMGLIKGRVSGSYAHIIAPHE